MKIYYRAEISSAHQLDLPYQSKCVRMHGHNYLVEVELEGQINQEGMIIDFTKIKEIIYKYDHITLNDIITQPTAENIVLHLLNDFRLLPDTDNLQLITIRVWEDQDSYAEETINLQ